MNKIIEQIKENSKKNKKMIVLPESMDRRVLEASSIVLKEGIADIILIGDEVEISNNSIGLDLSKATIINPSTYSLTDELVELLYELRREKGMTREYNIPISMDI